MVGSVPAQVGDGLRDDRGEGLDEGRVGAQRGHAHEGADAGGERSVPN